MQLICLLSIQSQSRWMQQRKILWNKTLDKGELLKGDRVKNSNPLRWNIPPSPLPLHCFVKDTEARQGPWQAPTLRELRADPVSWVTLIDGNWPPVVIVSVPLCRLMFRIKVGEPRKQRDRLEKIKSRRERKKPQNYRLCFKCSSFSLIQNQVLSDIQTHSNIIGQDWE